jgi:hypothetical protein
MTREDEHRMTETKRGEKYIHSGRNYTVGRVAKIK